MLCVRLRKVLPSIIIMENQSAFVEGRLILDDILTGLDLVRHYRRKHIPPRLVSKIDIRKACDTIDWEFLMEMMKGVGFPDAL